MQNEDKGYFSNNLENLMEKNIIRYRGCAIHCTGVGFIHQGKLFTTLHNAKFYIDQVFINWNNSIQNAGK